MSSEQQQQQQPNDDEVWCQVWNTLSDQDKVDMLLWYRDNPDEDMYFDLEMRVKEIARPS